MNNFKDIEKRIIKELSSKIYFNMSISYEEFLNLYEPYKSILEEEEFAKILGITYDNWQTIKNRGTRTKIKASGLNKEVSEMRINQIIEEIRSQGFENQVISYVEFLQLYEAYKNEMSEPDFAQMLGITYLNWSNLKIGKRRVKILKTVDETLDNKKIKSSKTSSFEEQQKQIEMQIQENSTPIDVMQMCLNTGMTRNQTLKYCMEKFGMTKIELLQMMTQTLQERKKPDKKYEIEI